MLQSNPELSLTYFEDTTLAVIIHGRGELMGAANPLFQILEDLQVENGGSSPRDWGEVVFIRIVPQVIYTYARDPT